jgi:hypothetical protein
VLLHQRVERRLVHRARGADGQPTLLAQLDITDPRQALQIDHAFGPDEPTAHADQQVGAAHERPHRAVTLEEQRAGLSMTLRNDIIEGLQR